MVENAAADEFHRSIGVACVAICANSLCAARSNMSDESANLAVAIAAGAAGTDPAIPAPCMASPTKGSRKK